MESHSSKAQLWQKWQAAGVNRYDAAEMFRQYEQIGCVQVWFAACLLKHYSHYPTRYRISGALRAYHRDIVCQKNEISRT